MAWATVTSAHKGCCGPTPLAAFWCARWLCRCLPFAAWDCGAFLRHRFSPPKPRSPPPETYCDCGRLTGYAEVMRRQTLDRWVVFGQRDVKLSRSRLVGSFAS